jgi:hypothetical protein
MRGALVVGAVSLVAGAAVVFSVPGQVIADGMVGPSSRLCFTVAGSPGDAALVNLTPVLATGFGDGQLISSDVATPPAASNVNFGPGTVDPNVAVAKIGADGKVCFANSKHSSVHLVADHLGTIPGASYAPATASGAPDRKVDTRPPTPPPTLPPTSPPPTVPSNPGDSKNCGDFATYAAAKAWFDTYFPYYGDVAGLDSDGDGIPCESLPGAP